MDNYKKWSQAFKALSQPNRLQLFLSILEEQNLKIESGDEDHQCIITEFIKNLNIGAPTISHHIKELTNANLITTEKKGKFLVCSVNTEYLQEIKDILKISNEEGV